MPFDRLIRTVDDWAANHGRRDVFAQIGSTVHRPKAIRWIQFLHPEEFRHHYENASVIVAHAGTGSIISALQLGKPILVMPRRASLHETRNDHQVATADQFRRFASVSVAWDEVELMASLETIDALRGSHSVGPHASRELVEAVRSFIDGT